MELSYTSLDKRLYTYCTPQQLKNPEMVIYNETLGTALGFGHLKDNLLALTAIFSGQQPFEEMRPIAQAYAGHQFGYFSMLGDGRAHLIGEIKTPSGQLVDCMLKGSGQTDYSRRGDGLADYAIHRHYGDEVESEPANGTQASKYLLFFQAVSRLQARLIAKWLSVGFVHGVMNTDNMMISGETMDYGPCAFMNAYDPQTVFSSIDTKGRYAYGNQPYIGKWNLARLAEALLPIIDQDKTKALEGINRVLAEFEEVFSTAYMNIMAAKLGFGKAEEGDGELIQTLLQWMEQYQADFTETFLRLTLRDVESLPFSALPAFAAWHDEISARQRKAYANFREVEEAMKRINPAFIPRNHLVESVLLQATEKASLTEFHHLLELIQDPFAYTQEQLAYVPPPLEFDKNYRTYCGT